ncbi:hypothetical protein [Paludisphaera rhizosphaerae]|uniref:hypothetical protein n=1 Tax=Paludisphaera rhizosphaerae TaxID=2711216 RepID=UPI0013E9DE51|nr:hypothetical protein [Paludisphaera rhizosphaerae]
MIIPRRRSTSPPPRRRAARLVFEPLEDRRLLARLELITPVSSVSIAAKSAKAETIRTAKWDFPGGSGQLLQVGETPVSTSAGGLFQQQTIDGLAVASAVPRGSTDPSNLYSIFAYANGSVFNNQSFTDSTAGFLDSIDFSYEFAVQSFRIVPEPGEKVGDTLVLQFGYNFSATPNGLTPASATYTRTLSIDPGNGQGMQSFVKVEKPSPDSPVGFSLSPQFTTKIGAVVQIGMKGEASLVAAPAKKPTGPGMTDLLHQSVGGGVTGSLVVTVPRVLRELIPTSLILNDTGVRAAYRIEDPDLAAPTEVGLYWSSTDEFAGAIGSPIVLETTPVARGDYGFTVPARALSQPPANAKFLLLVVDPNDKVAERTEEKDNTRALAILPDIALAPQGAIRWNPDQGGVFVNYNVTGLLADLPEIALYWSDGTTFNSRKTEAGTTIGGKTPGAMGAQVQTLTNPPEWAKYLIAYADPPDSANPDGKIKEASESNNIASIAWNPTLVFEKAKYDGDPDAATVGRFLPNPPNAAKPLIDDQKIIARLSDSLASLKPTITLVGRSATGDGFDDVFTMTATEDGGGRIYETSGFDPTLIVFHDEVPFVDERQLKIQATRLGSQLVSEKDQPTFKLVVMEKLPDWLTNLDVVTGSFGDDPVYGPSYEIAAMFASFTLSATTPDEIPWLAGQVLSYQAGLGVKMVVPLNSALRATLGAQAKISVQYGDLLSYTPISFDSIDLFEVESWGAKFSMTPLFELNPNTLAGPGDAFGATIKLDVDANLVSRSYTTLLPGPGGFLIPFEGTIDVGILGGLAVTVTQEPGAGFRLGDNSVVTGGVKLKASGGVGRDLDLASESQTFSNQISAFKKLLNARKQGSSFFNSAASIGGRVILDASVVASASYVGYFRDPQRLPGATVTATLDVTSELRLMIRLGDWVPVNEKLVGIQLLPGVFPLKKIFQIV